MHINPFYSKLQIPFCNLTIFFSIIQIKYVILSSFSIAKQSSLFDSGNTTLKNKNN